MVDAHRHLDSTKLSPDVPCVLVSRGPDEWSKILELLRNDPQKNHYYSVGVHPWFISEAIIAHQESHLNQLEAIISMNPELHLGEIGLDSCIQVSMDIQHEFLRKQLYLAHKYQRKVSLHCVKAYEPLRMALSEFTQVKGLIHAYSGSIEWMRQRENEGWRFSFGPEILDKKRKKSREAFIACQHPLLESDDRSMSIAEYTEFYRLAPQLREKGLTDFSQDLVSLMGNKNYI